MTGMFSAIGIAGTGLQTYHTWLDVIADNVANVNDTSRTDGTVFREHYVQAQSNGDGPEGTGTGVHVQALTQQQNDGVLVQDPTNPLADANGEVRHADVDLSEQMGDMIMAQRAFQANANVIDRVKTAYEAAMNIGKGI